MAGYAVEPGVHLGANLQWRQGFLVGADVPQTYETPPPTRDNLTGRRFLRGLAGGRGKTLHVSPEWVDGFMRGWANRPQNDAEIGLLDGTQCRLYIDRVPFIWERMEASEM